MGKLVSSVHRLLQILLMMSLTWMMRQQEVSLQLEAGPQTCQEPLVAPPTRSHAAIRQIHRHNCSTHAGKGESGVACSTCIREIHTGRK